MTGGSSAAAAAGLAPAVVTEHGGDLAAAESLVQILPQLDITYSRFPPWYRWAPAAVAERLANQPVNFGYRHLGLACL